MFKNPKLQKKNLLEVTNSNL